jgi:hypothetical protein
MKQMDREGGWNPGDPDLAGDFKEPPKVGEVGHGDPGGMTVKEMNLRMTAWLAAREGGRRCGSDKGGGRVK